MVDYQSIAEKINSERGTNFPPSLYENAANAIKTHYKRMNGEEFPEDRIETALLMIARNDSCFKDIAALAER